MALAFGLLAFSLMVMAGDLEPTSPPGPTMKTLDEVEPRVPIQSLSGNTSAVYVIDQPGSYYFTGDITIDVADKDGIRVDADDVTIDLMGFSLIGQGSGSGDGIRVIGTSSNVEIRNGTVFNHGSSGVWGGEQYSDYSCSGHRQWKKRD